MLEWRENKHIRYLGINLLKIIRNEKKLFVFRTLYTAGELSCILSQRR